MQTKKPRFLTIGQLGLLIAAGIILGNVLVFLDKNHSPQNILQNAFFLTIIKPSPVPHLLYSKKVNSCQAFCSQPPEKTAVQENPTSRRGRPVLGVTRTAKIPTNPKNPNAIRISLAEAPTILSKVNMVNGKGTCIKKNDKGHKSKKFNYVHIDRQCCLDPDEIPNPRCLYK